jgi:hypothetical protein
MSQLHPESRMASFTTAARRALKLIYEHFKSSMKHFAVLALPPW